MRTLIVLALALLPVASFADTTVSFVAGRSHASWHGQAEMQALNIEMGRAVTPRLDVAFVFAPTRFDQPRSWFGDQYGDGNEDVNALAGALLVRYRFAEKSRLPFFVEAAMGPMWAEKAVPASTSRFNFMSHFGAGVVLMPRARFPLVAGYRFHHISNGGYSPRNPGVNVSSVTLGLRLCRR